MIEERAVVVTSDASGVLVTAPGPAGCARCAEGKGCGGGVLGRLTRRKKVPTVRALNPSQTPYSAGESVVIGLRDEALVGASLLVYLFPLVSMLILAVVAHLGLGFGEGATVLAGLVGLASGFAWVARRAGQQDWMEHYRPVVLRRANGETSGQCSSEPSGL